MVTHKSNPGEHEAVAKEPTPTPHGVVGGPPQVTPFAVTTTVAGPAPFLEFFQVTGANVRVRVYDTTLGFEFQADIPAATWTAINTYMVTNSVGSFYQVPIQYGGKTTRIDYAS